MSDQHLGCDFDEVLTSAQRIASGKGHNLGARAVSAEGYEWMYVKASAAIPQYNLVTIYAGGTAQPFASAAVAGSTAAIRALGISASSSIPADGYGWLMISGVAALKVCASSTGTIVGQLYAAASANAGLVQITASGGIKITSLFAQTTSTTSTTASTFPVVFGRMFHAV